MRTTLSGVPENRINAPKILVQELSIGPDDLSARASIGWFGSADAFYATLQDRLEVKGDSLSFDCRYHQSVHKTVNVFARGPYGVTVSEAILEITSPQPAVVSMEPWIVTMQGDEEIETPFTGPTKLDSTHHLRLKLTFTATELEGGAIRGMIHVKHVKRDADDPQDLTISIRAQAKPAQRIIDVPEGIFFGKDYAPFKPLLPKSFKITNSGDLPLTVKSIKLAGGNEGFSIVESPSTIELGPQEWVPVKVLFIGGAVEDEYRVDQVIIESDADNATSVSVDLFAGRPNLRPVDIELEIMIELERIREGLVEALGHVVDARVAASVQGAFDRIRALVGRPDGRSPAARPGSPAQSAGTGVPPRH
jgi:hypothetical protein